MSFSSSDTIVAIATPPGRGGIGVVRVSGPGAAELVSGLIEHPGNLEPRRALFTRLGPATAVRDQVIVTSFPAPHSYTGEDVVEVSAHGSPVILRSIVEAAISRGARLAEPGEFTLRAFLNGRIDLIQAEAVADLVDAVTPDQARLAFDQLEGTSTRSIADLDDALFDLIARLEASVDFPDEGYHFVHTSEVAMALHQLIGRASSLLSDFRRGRLVREGLQVAIVGRPNVGKSSLFNALVGSERAIVTDRPGTTRDLVSEVVDIHGLKVTLVDTAGVRDTSDPAEAEGVSRSRQAARVADLVLVVVDEDDPETPNAKHFVVQSKADLGRPDRGIRVSARTGEGLDDLRRAVAAGLDFEPLRDRPQITNVRHATLLERAIAALTRAREAAEAETPAAEEFILADLQDARHALEEMTGRRTPEDLLTHIFSRFCVGK
jgi:tRNA modification GTPase